jgi:DNA-binding MarR family transcriptional regulator
MRKQSPKSQDKRMFFLLNLAQKKLFKYVDSVCEAELGASVTQMAALMYLAKAPGCLQKDLAAVLDLNKSAVTGLITRMEKNALVTRTVHEHDGRAVLLSVTPDGLSKVTRLLPMIETLNNEFTDEFSEQELATVLRFLNFILQKF